MARILLTLGALPPLPAERIDHNATRPTAPAEGATAEYGHYLVNGAACAECHGAQLAGGQADPNEPVGPNLTPGGRLSGWRQEDFSTPFARVSALTARRCTSSCPGINTVI